MICYEIIMFYFETVLGHRTDPPCSVRGHMACPYPLLFQIRAKPYNNRAEKIAKWKFSKGVFT